MPRNPPPMYAIFRLEAKPGIWYWSVAFRRRGKHYYKSFYDLRRGGPEKSLAAAIKWRDEQLAKAPALYKRDFCQLLRTTNTSGIPGVQFIRQVAQPQGSWQARVKLSTGKELTRAFSVRKYGEREAYERAVAARKAFLEEVENKPVLWHPYAKKICAKQEAATKKKHPARSAP